MGKYLLMNFFKNKTPKELSLEQLGTIYQDNIIVLGLENPVIQGRQILKVTNRCYFLYPWVQNYLLENEPKALVLATWVFYDIPTCFSL